QMKRIVTLPLPAYNRAIEEWKARMKPKKFFYFAGIVGMGGPQGRTRAYDTQNPFDLGCED
ncbi:hypothetical protein, partial [Bacillus spizizenii]|uniref:hypothetical protein n=1 Tax=Bacillus spizizenii TaxID=96241 RepID=UPI002DB69DEF